MCLFLASSSARPAAALLDQGLSGAIEDGPIDVNECTRGRKPLVFVEVCLLDVHGAQVLLIGVVQEEDQHGDLGHE